jgi:hypothetical protein
MPEKGQLFVKRVNRDKTHIAMLEEEIKKFLEVDVAKVIQEINEAMEKL